MAARREDALVIRRKSNIRDVTRMAFEGVARGVLDHTRVVEQMHFAVVVGCDQELTQRLAVAVHIL